MLKINTSNVALGAAMPYKSTMINWLYTNDKYTHWELASSLMNDYNANTIALVGCTNSIVGSTHTITDGFIYQGTEIYQAGGDSITLSVGQVVVGTITSSYPLVGTSDPVTFSDGTTHNVHEAKVVVWSAGTSGSGDFDYDDLVFLHEEWQSPTYLTGWSDDNWNSNGGLKYKRDMIGNALVFKGSCQSSNNGGTGNPVFTLPAAYRPATSKTLPIIINEDSGSTIVVAFLLISASTGNVVISSATASTTIDIASFDGIRIPLD